MKLTSKSPPVLEGRSVFVSTIKPPIKVNKILKPGSSNSKLGYIIKKGKWKGFPLFSLTLEERKTCPSSCYFWRDCYGNNMYLAERIDHTHPRFLIELNKELRSLSKLYPKGFVIRLHILGDFYSTDYVRFWEQSLKNYPNLFVFGYTARHNCNIGRMVTRVWKENPDRFIIRFSGYEYDDRLTTNKAEGEFEGTICPEQTGKVDKCAKCALCWNNNITQPILFIQH